MTNANVTLGINGVNNTGAAFGQARSQIASLRGGMNGMGSSVRANRRLIQQFGMQVSDFSVQVAGGQSAILAFTQNVPQFIQGFGAIGGILAGLITVFGTIWLVMYRTGMALSELAPLAGVLADELSYLGAVFTAIKNAAIGFANIVINNLDRMVITALVAIAYFGGAMVGAFLKARLAALTLAGALNFLRGVMMRVLPLALIVIAGELFFRFMKLAEAAGGLGAAFGMLLDVVIEFGSKIKYTFLAIGTYIGAVWEDLSASASEMVQSVIGYMVDLANNILNTFEGAYQAVVAVWKLLPGAFKDIGAMAMNGMLTVVEEGVNGMAKAVGDFFEWMGGAFEAVNLSNPFAGMLDGNVIDLSGFKAEITGAASNAAATMKSAFDGAFADNPISMPDTGLPAAAAAARTAANTMHGAADDFANAANAPYASIAKLRALIAGMPDDAQVNVTDWFKGVEQGAAGAGGAAEKAAEKVKGFADSVKGVFMSGLDKMFDAMFEGGKEAVAALRDIGKELLKLVAKQQLFSFLGKFMPKTFGAGGFLDLSAGNTKMFAKGGVVNSPTPFGMRGGKRGMAGEAGPEAILPLTRGPNGSMGVQAMGGGAAAGTVVNVITPPGARVSQSQRSGPGGGSITDIVVQEMQAATSSGKMDRVNRQRFGSGVVPVKR